MYGLDGKVVVVTGGNRGIGAYIVKGLEDAGAKVAYTSRQASGNSSSLHVAADVTDGASMQAMYDKVEAELGPVYGVVANAGIVRDAMMHKMQGEQWDDVIGTNLTGVYNTIRPILPKLYERKEGSVVAISSIIGQRGGIGQTNYAATKAGTIGMVQSLAREAARNKVRVNAVAPGYVETEMLTTLPEKVREKLYAEIPMGRFAEPHEIAFAIIFLLSPQLSSFITGEVIKVNGGHLI